MAYFFTLGIWFLLMIVIGSETFSASWWGIFCCCILFGAGFVDMQKRIDRRK